MKIFNLSLSLSYSQQTFDKTSILDISGNLALRIFSRHFYLRLPKCELPKVIIRHNIGPISAAKSRPLLLGQCHCLHRSSAGPTTADFFDCLNLPTFSRNMAQYRPYTKPIVIFTMASSSQSRRARVRLMDGTLLRHVSLLPGQTLSLKNFANFITFLTASNKNFELQKVNYTKNHNK